ncbi:MAG: CRISPR-associated helicase Cas3', partial [Rubrobacter sp.]|nr:CRISPR-associated helicase Cas3' [Rubrobacter sp.]
HRLLEGESLVLVSPTGSGKSWAALLAFIYARRHGLPFADRLIYAFPLRTLTTALYRQYGEVLEKEDLRPTLQMGGMERDEGDPFFEGDVVFTTIDQLLSSYIGAPVSLPRRLANMPAGALIGSCIVFDEFHLLEPERAQATALDLAHRLRQYSRVLLMSATFSGKGVEEIGRRYKMGKREVLPEEIKRPDRPETKRRFIWSNQTLTAEPVLSKHRKKSIAVCNTVDRAVGLYRSLVSLAKERGMEDRILLLHSRFLPEDRKRKEDEILKIFGKEGGDRAILVATQVVEVGLDISADVLHTELAPASALLQRAGRCARFGGEGTVCVYELPLKGEGRSTAPYTGTQASLIGATADGIAAKSGEVLGFKEERDLVDEVHAETDLRVLKSINPNSRRLEINKAIREGSGANVRLLVRDVDAVNLVIHRNPGRLRMELPFPSISVARSVVKGFLAELRSKGELGKALMLSPSEDRVESENYAPEANWKAIEKVEEADQTFYICLPPDLASYTPEEGLVLGRPGRCVFEQDIGEADHVYEPYSYRKETWVEHVERVMGKYSEQSEKHRVGATRLGKELGVAPEKVEQMGLLAAALHDLGKLAKEWQDKIWLWQKSVRPREPRDCFLAHSDFDGTNDQQRKRIRDPKYRKPPHAVESYYAGLEVLMRSLPEALEVDRIEVVAALGSAIARHHAAFASTLGEFQLDAGYREEVRNVLGRLGVDMDDLPDHPSATQRQKFAQDWIINPEHERHEDVLPLYWYVARRLRLADQRSHDWTGEGHES